MVNLIKVAKKITSKYENVTFHWYGDGTLYNKYKELTKDEPNIIFHGHNHAPAGPLDTKRRYISMVIRMSVMASWASP